MNNTPEIFVIIDTSNDTFWKSANDKTSWPSTGTAKTAFGSSKNNPTKVLYARQTRFRIARLELEGGGFKVKYV